MSVGFLLGMRGVVVTACSSVCLEIRSGLPTSVCCSAHCCMDSHKVLVFICKSICLHRFCGCNSVYTCVLPGTLTELGAAAAILRKAVPGQHKTSAAPLRVASDKSGMGHSEPSAGMMGLLTALRATHEQVRAYVHVHVDVCITHGYECTCLCLCLCAHLSYAPIQKASQSTHLTHESLHDTTRRLHNPCCI